MKTTKKNTIATNTILATAGWNRAVDWEALGWTATIRDGVITVWSPEEEANNSPGGCYGQYDLAQPQAVAVFPNRTGEVTLVARIVDGVALDRLTITGPRGGKSTCWRRVDRREQPGQISAWDATISAALAR